MRVRLVDTGDRMNLGEHQLGQRILMGNFDDGENVRFAPAGINLFDLLNRRQSLDDIRRLTGVNIDQHIGFVRHAGNLRGELE